MLTALKNSRRVIGVYEKEFNEGGEHLPVSRLPNQLKCWLFVTDKFCPGLNLCRDVGSALWEVVSLLVC